MKPPRDANYRAWVRTLPCTICQRRPSEPHHALPSVTAQRATDYCCIPLCRQHHDMALNRKEFARRFTLDIPVIINRLNREYLETRTERQLSALVSLFPECGALAGT